MCVCVCVFMSVYAMRLQTHTVIAQHCKGMTNRMPKDWGEERVEYEKGGEGDYLRGNREMGGRERLGKGQERLEKERGRNKNL